MTVSPPATTDRTIWFMWSFSRPVLCSFRTFRGLVRSPNPGVDAASTMTGRCTVEPSSTFVRQRAGRRLTGSELPKPSPRLSFCCNPLSL